MTHFARLTINLIPIILISTFLFILLEKSFAEKD